MLDNNIDKNEIKKILDVLNAEAYPQTHSYLSELLEDEFIELTSPYELATKIAECDRRNSMQPVVFNYLVKLYEAEMRAGNPAAMNDLGALYYDGRGCEQDFKKAMYYYNMAAENGSRQAQENLGYCYYYGRDVEVDYEKAFHYFALGAFDGHLISLYKIGDMYKNGHYVKKNEKEAFHIYDRCMDMMTDEAAPVVAGPVFLRLGEAFLYGRGTKANAMRALFCYQSAERYLFDMVNGGDVMYKKSLQAAIDGQAEARKKLNGESPISDWLDGTRK